MSFWVSWEMDVNKHGIIIGSHVVTLDHSL
jgi:hypothetical protein